MATPKERNIVSVDLAEIQKEIDEIIAADPVGGRTRGAIIKAALRVGLPILRQRIAKGRR